MLRGGWRRKDKGEKTRRDQLLSLLARAGSWRDGKGSHKSGLMGEVSVYEVEKRIVSRRKGRTGGEESRVEQRLDREQRRRVSLLSFYQGTSGKR